MGVMVVVVLGQLPAAGVLGDRDGVVSGVVIPCLVSVSPHTVSSKTAAAGDNTVIGKIVVQNGCETK